MPAIAYGMSEEQAAMIGHTDRKRSPDLSAARSPNIAAWSCAMRGRASRRSDARATLGFRSLEIVPLFGLDGQRIGELVMLFRHSAWHEWAHGEARRGLRADGRLRRDAGASGAPTPNARARHTEQAGRAKIQFFARMSHELRTPLQSIAGYIDLLAGSARGAAHAQRRHHLLGRIHESEEILVHVIDDLITFSRLEAGHVSYSLGPVSRRKPSRHRSRGLAARARARRAARDSRLPADAHRRRGRRQAQADSREPRGERREVLRARWAR